MGRMQHGKVFYFYGGLGYGSEVGNEKRTELWSFSEQDSCPTNYYGGLPLCDVTTCGGIFSNETASCGSLRACLSFEYCECLVGTLYVGEACNVTTCSGTSSIDGGVCSDHGVCWPYNFCPFG